MLAIVFGAVDPIFRTPAPIWNPLHWQRRAVRPTCSTTSSAANAIFGPALLRTVVYVVLASVLCLAIAFPVAYYVAG